MGNLITPLSSSKVDDKLDTYVADDEIEVDSPFRVDNIHATLQHHYTMATSSSRYRVHYSATKPYQPDHPFAVSHMSMLQMSRSVTILLHKLTAYTQMRSPCAQLLCQAREEGVQGSFLAEVEVQGDERCGSETA